MIILLILLLLCLFKSGFTGNLYNGNKWDEYRLGDVYYYWGDNNAQTGPLGYHLTKFPGSIASEYIRRNAKMVIQDRQLLYELIRENQNNIQLNDNDLILHIRTGDVMCKDFKTDYGIDYTRKNDTIWWNEIIEYIKKNNIKKVYILSGSHFNKCIKESQDYLKDRRQFLINNCNVTVEYRIGKSPDEDMVFTSKSKHFISTGGGYGRLLNEIKILT
jgi:hypothetical protein